MSLRHSRAALVLVCTFALAGHADAITPVAPATRTLIAVVDIASCIPGSTARGDAGTARCN